MRAWSKTDYYQIFQDNTRTEIPSSFVCDWFRSERMPPSIGSGMCIYWYPKRNEIQPPSISRLLVDRRETRNIFFIIFFPRISTAGPIKGPGDTLCFFLFFLFFYFFRKERRTKMINEKGNRVLDFSIAYIHDICAWCLTLIER